MSLDAKVQSVAQGKIKDMILSVELRIWFRPRPDKLKSRPLNPGSVSKRGLGIEHEAPQLKLMYSCL